VTTAEAVELPALDDEIARLDADERERIGREWLRRAEVELSAATLSAQIVRGLLLDGAVQEVLELAGRAVSDEIRHARICQSVAEAYLGRPAPAPRSRPMEEGRFGDAPPEVNRLLSLVLHSCLNETFATVCLREGMIQCSATTARAATRLLLRDDLDHARIGWAHLASPAVDAAAKLHVSRAMPVLLRLAGESWMNEPRASFEAPGHGVLPAASFPAFVRTALRLLVLPGFEHVGVDTRAGREWCQKNVDGW